MRMIEATQDVDANRHHLFGSMHTCRSLCSPEPPAAVMTPVPLRQLSHGWTFRHSVSRSYLAPRSVFGLILHLDSSSLRSALRRGPVAAE